MKIVYQDISEEFIKLMAEAAQNYKSVRYIKVSRAEMQQLIKHENARRYFGDYLSRRDARIATLESEVKTLQQRLVGKTQTESMAIYAEMTNLEKQIDDIRNEVPREIRQSNVLVKVTL
jgi:polyhydroxyalkanoate synthesis regulator phasin